MKVVEQTDSEIVLYPSWGLLQPDGGYRLQLAGCVYQHGEINLRKRLLLKLLRRAMKVEPEEMAGELFQSRIKPFMDKADRGQAIQLKIGSQSHLLNELTQKNGHFRSSWQISRTDVAMLLHDGQIQNSRLAVSANIACSPENQARGQIELLQARGISIVSDIDDTIKISNVGSLSQLLTNTFLREFQEVEGMSDVYRDWANRGARFHYVSSSPWQLFQPLINLRVRSRFPHGSFHLREFKWRDQMLGRIHRPQFRGKSAVIQNLLRQMPERKFVLIGDSGEHDPEIYVRVCQRYPRRVLGLFIRQLDQRPLAARRLEKICAQLGDTSFGVFGSSQELAQLADPLFEKAARRGD